MDNLSPTDNPIIIGNIVQPYMEPQPYGYLQLYGQPQDYDKTPKIWQNDRELINIKIQRAIKY